MAFEFASFVMRNKMYSIKNWRGLSKVRKNMKSYVLLNPACEFCGRTKNLNVHHIIPIWADPLLAWVITNFVTLCRKCHLYVGHNGNYAQRYEEKILLLISNSKVAKKVIPDK